MSLNERRGGGPLQAASTATEQGTPLTPDLPPKPPTSRATPPAVPRRPELDAGLTGYRGPGGQRSFPGCCWLTLHRKSSAGSLQT